VRRRRDGISTPVEHFRHPSHRASVPHGDRRPRRTWKHLTAEEIFTAGWAASGLERELPRSPTNVEALELDYLPPHLIVLGGGYVGLEWAQAYQRFGAG
jgi:pyruvate/2-oxoglutarate dehydrogenase complex dihydrolipoamide dehydrogenase (E3) component